MCHTLSSSLKKNTVPKFMPMSELCRGLFAFPVIGENEPTDTTKMQNRIPLHLQPRSLPKMERQWPDLTLSLFSCPWTLRTHCRYLVFFGHLAGLVRRLESQIGWLLCCGPSPYDSAVTLTSAEDPRAATEMLLNSPKSTVVDGIKRPFNN